MPDTIHSSCKRCGQPMSYDPESDMMVCHDCGYKEKVKNNVTINNIVNNNTIQTQGEPSKSNAERDDDYRYINCVERLRAYQEQGDADAIGMVIEELRKSFPHSYFYHIAYKFGDSLTNLIVDPAQFKGIGRNQTHHFVNAMQSPAFKDSSDTFTGLNYDMQVKAYSILERILGGQLPDEARAYLYDNAGKKRETTIDYYLDTLKTAKKTADTVLSAAFSIYAEYDIDIKHHEDLAEVSEELADLIDKLQKLSDREDNFIVSNIDKVQEVVDMGASKSVQNISQLVEGRRTTGLVCTLVGLGLFIVLLGLAAILTAVINPENYNLIHGWIFIFGCLSTICQILNMVAKKRQGNKLTKEDYIECGVVLLFVVIWLIIFESTSLSNNSWLCLVYFVPAFLGEILAIKKLPKMIREHKEIKATQAEYNQEIDEARRQHEQNSSSTSYDDLFDLILDFDYDFSSWEE